MRRRTIVDEYVEDDQVVVFVDGQVITLSPLATTALLAVGEGWAEDSAVTDTLVAQFGAPPEGFDPTDLTRTTLESLAEQGLIDVEGGAR